MDDIADFQLSRKESIEKAGANKTLRSLALNFITETLPFRYSYNFDWLGLPIIQFPQDIVAVQEIIWKTKPDIIIETGVARGGSLILSASILHLLNGNGKVIGIDIDIRKHNREALERHPLFFRIQLLEGSSLDSKIINQVKKMISPCDKVMVILDSNHTHEHVLAELIHYSPLVTKDSYLIVMDSIIEELPSGQFVDRPWDKGNNPKTAIHQFLNMNNHFVIDYEIQNKLLITVAPDGYLKCLR